MATETEQLEIWKPVPGFDRYEVSSLGRVRSTGHVFWHEPSYCWHKRPGRILKTHVVDRYAQVSLHDGEKQSTCFVHAMVLEAFAGPRPDGMVARHLNGDRLDNRASNLAWGTPADNSADMIAHGHSMKGEKHHAAKLTWPEVDKIRAACKAGTPHKIIAAEHGVSKSTISMIQRNAIWKEAA